MYNRYIPGSAGYTRVVVEESEERAERKTSANKDGENAWRKTSPFAFLGGEDKNAGIAGILKSLHLDGPRLKQPRTQYMKALHHME